MTDDNDVQYEIRIVKIRFNVTAGWIDCCRDNYWASLLNFNLPQGPIHALAFSPSGKFLASGATDGRVLLWDIGHGLMVSELKGHTDTIYTLKFSRDGEILASGGWPTVSLNFTSVDYRISTVQNECICPICWTLKVQKMHNPAVLFICWFKYIHIQISEFL